MKKNTLGTSKRPDVCPGTLLFCDDKYGWEKYDHPKDDYPYGISLGKVGMVISYDPQYSTSFANTVFMAFLLTEDGAFWTICLYSEIVSAYE